jgi:hypothetical protein
MTLIVHLEKLDCNAHVISAFAEAVFQHILHSKITPNLVQAFFTVFVFHHRSPRENFWSSGVQDPVLNKIDALLTGQSFDGEAARGQGESSLAGLLVSPISSGLSRTNTYSAVATRRPSE